MSQLKVNSIVDASGGNAAVLNGVVNAPQSMSFRNRIINGDMRIDQRNNGALVNGLANTSPYVVDRLLVGVGANAVSIGRTTTAPAGFTHSAAVFIGTGSAPTTQFIGLLQNIEGFNVADLGFGTVNAQAVTLSFWVRSSVAGTHAGRLGNAGSTRVYVFTYAINAANTWEYKTITFPGDTTGTWLTDNGTGLQVVWDLGSAATFNGTAGAWGSANVTRTSGSVTLSSITSANFYITGVQLEAGTVATPFERVDYGTQLIRCQRYFQTYAQPPLRGVVASATAVSRGGMVLPIVMRAAPTAVVGALPVFDGSGTSTVSAVNNSYLSATVAEFDFNTSTSLTAGRPAIFYQTGTSTMTLSAEL